MHHLDLVDTRSHTLVAMASRQLGYAQGVGLDETHTRLFYTL
jgi:hypothetical protein